MWAPATAQELTGGRLHLAQGPIDLVLKAWGKADDVRAAHRAATLRFETILTELSAELAELRRPMSDAPDVGSPVARRMVDACRPFGQVFITPMAAVAGSVADEVLDAMRRAATLERAFVNNGGDIACHVAAGHRMMLGIAGDFSGGPVPALNGRVRLSAEDGIGGIATSGVHGRSFSLGIADSVTVLARSAATADAAATLVANAVDIESSAIRRDAATSLDPDSDLGHRLVTVEVGDLTPHEIATALGRGVVVAEQYLESGLVAGAALLLRGEERLVGRALNRIEGHHA